MLGGAAPPGFDTLASAFVKLEPGLATLGFVVGDAGLAPVALAEPFAVEPAALVWPLVRVPALAATFFLLKCGSGTLLLDDVDPVAPVPCIAFAARPAPANPTPAIPADAAAVAEAAVEPPAVVEAAVVETEAAADPAATNALSRSAFETPSRLGSAPCPSHDKPTLRPRTARCPGVMFFS